MLPYGKRCDPHRSHHQFGKPGGRLQGRQGVQLRHDLAQLLHRDAAFVACFDMGRPMIGELTLQEQIQLIGAQMHGVIRHRQVALRRAEDWVSLFEMREKVSEFMPCTMDVGLHSPQWQVERLGNFFVRQTLDMTEQNAGSILGSELRDGTLDGAAKLAGLEFLERRFALVADLQGRRLDFFRVSRRAVPRRATRCRARDGAGDRWRRCSRS